MMHAVMRYFKDTPFTDLLQWKRTMMYGYIVVYIIFITAYKILVNDKILGWTSEILHKCHASVCLVNVFEKRLQKPRLNFLCSQ